MNTKKPEAPEAPPVKLAERDTTFPPKRVAEMLGVKPGTLAIWRHRGQGPKFISINKRRCVYRLSDIREWLESRVRQSTTADAA